MLQLGKDPPFPLDPRGRVCSSFDFDSMIYDYWIDASVPKDPQGYNWRPPAVHGKDVSPIGSPIEAFLRELPPTAKWIGRGVDAKGEVVVRNRRQALWGKTNIPNSAGLRGVDGIGSNLPEPLDAGKALFYGGLVAIGLVFAWKLRQASKSI